MDYKEYQQRRNSLERTFRLELESLTRRFIESLPFKVGDKVKIKNHRIGWITSIRPHSWGIEILYNPPKKDGTRSIRKIIEYVSVEDVQKIL